jgi:pimeloyl-ACP methyl ester carboxylesterase
MTTQRIDDESFDYEERGAGEPLVLVHGSASDRRTWDAQLDSFGARYRTIAYSRRFHWPNAPIPDGADYSMEAHVDDLEALLTTLNAAPAHLVGHSYGGFVCLLLAIRVPELVRTLVLAEPPVATLFVSSAPGPAELLSLALTRPRTALSVARFIATGLGPARAAARKGDLEEAMRRFGRAVLGPAFYHRLSPARREQIRANAIRAEFLGPGLPPLRDEDVRAVRAPTLLVTGRESPRFFHRLVDRLDELLPRSARLEIPGASHSMHEDEPARYDAGILAFLAAHAAT